ncbi:MAG: hypothetical protein V7785_18020 [Bermanella sp.]
MINTNAITKELAHALSSIGTSFTFKADSIAAHSVDGRVIDYVHWKKGDLCLIRGLIMDDEDEGLCIEVSTYERDYCNEIGELYQIPLSNFDRVLSKLPNGFSLIN